MFSKTKDIPFSPIKRIQAEAERLGAVSLAQGIPRFLPPLEVRRAAIAAIEEGKADFYGPPRGIPELRQKISEWHLSREKSFYDPEKEVLVTAGALQGMAGALTAFLSPGDELLIPTPSYFPFLNIPKVIGVKPVFVPLKPPEWRLNLADLKSAITPKTRGIVICHPNNPTGTVYTKAELEEIVHLAEKLHLWIFADEVYRFFVDPKVHYVSLGEIAEARSRLVRLMSFSKAFSLSGWRVGYLLADAPAAAEILKTHEMFTTAGASLPAQYAALSALGDFPDLPQRFAQILLGRRERMRKRLQRLSDRFEFRVPEGAYYFFVKLKGRETAEEVSRQLLEKAGVATVPGSAFGPGGEGYLRLSFAAKEGEIEEAFDRLERHFGSRQAAGAGGGELEALLAGATGVTDDSRVVGKGNIFVAVSGANYDGHDFAAEAIKNGAEWVVGERDLNLPRYRRVGNSRAALGRLCAAWHGHPSRKLKTIAVTGTDGKTTTAHLLGAILNRAGIETEVLSTISVPGLHTTTPPAPVLQKLLAEAVEKGKKAAVVEVTSHGIAQERIAGTRFEAAVLTNVTPEHLDYHETFERYRDTKSRLFTSIPLAVLNREDPSFGVLSRAAGGRIVSYGFGSESDFTARDLKDSPHGYRFLLGRGGETAEVSSPLPGEYNVQNALAAAAAAAVGFGVPLAEIKKALEEFDPGVLAGRFERIGEISDRTVLVDFAHTPAALAKVLNHVALTKPTGSRLLVVFGAAGERDHVKRPEMGAIAARTADLAVLTSEDPRSEDPGKIIDEIATGCFSAGAVEGKNFVRVPDRRQAIRAALKASRPGDTILILGKGHETTMAIKGEEHPWSDQKAAKEEFAMIFD